MDAASEMKPLGSRFTKDSLRTCEEQLVWIFAGYDEINYHLVIGRNYSQFILGNGVLSDEIEVMMS